MDTEKLIERQAILDTIEALQAGTTKPVLLSTIQQDMGKRFNASAFEALRRDGVIVAEFPDARGGDSGLQHWNFAILVPMESKNG